MASSAASVPWAHSGMSDLCLFLPGVSPVPSSRQRRHKDEGRVVPDGLRRCGCEFSVVSCRFGSSVCPSANFPKRSSHWHERIKREIRIQITIWPWLFDTVAERKAPLVRPRR